ncbi:MAG: hypothetical protein MUP69_10205 [Candidatus Atribacteria bacterium]|nr:hypothetical protein [Candidatus Atribacteria bacterium]
MVLANVNKTVVNVDLELDTGVVVTPVAFTSDTTDGDTETLIIIPTRPGRKLVLIVNNVAGAQGNITLTCAAGNYWAAQAMTPVVVAQGTSKAVVFTPARYQITTGIEATEGKIIVVVTPVHQLVTDHTATWQCFQLPGVDRRLPYA